MMTSSRYSKIVAGDLFFIVAKLIVVRPRVHDFHKPCAAGLVGNASWVARELHASVGRAVVRAVTAKNLVAPRVKARRFQSVLIRFRPTEGVEKSVDVSGDQVGQFFRQVAPAPRLRCPEKRKAVGLLGPSWPHAL